MDTVDKLRDNLNLLMAELGISAEELSRRIGVPASTIKKIKNQSDTNPTLSTLTPLAGYFSLTISQLIGDDDLPASRKKGSYKMNVESLNYIPLISWQDAIRWPSDHKQNYTTISTEHLYSKNAYALLVEEENWENLAKNTALLIDPSLEIEHRDFVIVYKEGQKIPSLKQALFDEGNIYLKPLIQGYNIVISTEQHRFLGVVVEYKKHLKGVSNYEK